MNQVRLESHPRVRLTEARMELGLSQRKVAEYLGTTAVTVSRWERGITRPIPYFRQKLCAFFEKATWELDLVYQQDEGSLHTQGAPLHSQSAHHLAVNGAPALAHGGIGPCALIDPALPVPSTIHLIGRDVELAQMRSCLCGMAKGALIALNGLPGVGKTALVITLAHDPDVRAYFKDGILWAGLGPEPNIYSHLNRWGTLLGLSQSRMSSLQSIEAWATTLRLVIGSRSMLFIIDDAWTVEDALVFKVGGIHCAHLVTTRFPALAARVSTYRATTINALDSSEGIALLRLLAPQVVEAEPERACELVEAVGGLPLALTLMGSYLRTQAATGQPRRIAAALHLLSHASERLDLSALPEPVEYHPSPPGNTPVSLRTIIALTDQHLPESTRYALHALSVFPPRPNSFSEEAATAVAACPVEALDALTDSGLLEINSSGRLTLHQTIADYARQQLCDNRAYRRLISYTTAFVERHRKDYELLESESSNILAALEAAAEQTHDADLTRTAIAFAPFLLARGLYQPAEIHLQRAYNVAMATADHNGLAGVLLYLGEMTWKRGDYEQAEKYLQTGLGYARKIDDHERICEALANLGSISWKGGDYKQAEMYLWEGLTLARNLANLERMCELLQVLGSVERMQGQYARSEAYLLEGLNLARQIGEKELTCPIVLNLGAISSEQGNYVQAEVYYQEGLELARQLQHSEWISGFLNNLGDSASEQGNYDQAMRYFQEGLELARQIEHSEWISFLLYNLGLTTRKQRNYTLSAQYLQESISLAYKIGIPQITCHSLYEQGNLHLDQHLPDLAETNFREILAIVPKGGQDFIALAQYGLARVAAVQGRLEEARELGEKSRGALESMGRRETQEVESWLRSLQDSCIAAKSKTIHCMTLYACGYSD